MWGYAEIGERLARAGVPDHPGYATWIATYADPEFLRLAAWARGLADAAGADAGPGGRERMHAAFRRSSEHELAFWEAAWASAETAALTEVRGVAAGRGATSRRIATETRPGRGGSGSSVIGASWVAYRPNSQLRPAKRTGPSVNAPLTLPAPRRRGRAPRAGRPAR